MKNSSIDAVKASIFIFSRLNHMKNHVTVKDLAQSHFYTRETEENDRCNVTPFSKYPPLFSDSEGLVFPSRFHRISVNERPKR